MRLELKREATAGGATYGVMSVEGQIYCQTLEPPIREIKGKPVADWKVQDNTAIPEGDYQIFRAPSPHFRMRVLPHLKDVPGFDYVMIHLGNTVRDTHACITIGTHRAVWELLGEKVPAVINSAIALDPLDRLIADELAKNHSVTISISNPVEAASGTV